MLELFHAAFSAVNFIPTALLVFVVFYWLLVILGAVDISSFDIDVDIDLDSDIDLDADAEVDGGSEASISWINNILAFFNLDKIPLMVFLTFLILPMWVISIMTNYILGNTSFILSLVFLIPNFIVSLLIAKPSTYPFVKIFSILDKETENTQDLLGTVGKVIISASDQKLGQGEVLLSGSNYRINIKTKRGHIKRGQKMLVVNHEKGASFYIVEPYETID